MHRRKFIIGLGAAVSGIGAAMGTGAFSSVEADRSVAITVADDSTAYLALDATDNTTEFVDQDADGQFRVRLDDSVTAGEGVNPNAVTRIEEAFTIRYQGTNGSGPGDQGAVNTRLFNDGEDVTEALPEDVVQFVPTEAWPNGGQSDLTVPGRAASFGPGEAAAVDIVLDTTVLEDGGSGLLLDQISFEAAADPFDVLDI
ncbi:uncharacterized protein Nmag_1331 [Natrialba magadii ATCC 43099]|uniref:DUF1102 domain-containing protein n=1 Tax=Natrialba magadii (strain ATCC 43099 / DSM 3394 / CCM 3739 / CIP 104546 / IAM 13178 / JCM 8861 / NBRC 102185 / NCIMB 2190 / MS3) TaxID=547559 RepID=D3SSW4_NATMM|nr:hypothetical protein [Natrialba magadii]ADD04910.1 uncharacterized protein Nmag_1331 [Natrialba magadii ATCC 43099]ELY23959.1 hypothetical protein C500_19175 [Natrialba magadii ATCC 43099]